MITEAELIRNLQALSVDWPEPVDVTDRVMARVRSTRRGWLPSAAVQRGLSFAALAVIAAFVGVLLLVPGARTAVARFLGFPGISVEQSADPPPQGLATDAEVKVGDLGELVTLDQASERVDFTLRTLPQQPIAVYYDEAASAVHITYALGGGRRALLTQLHSNDDIFFNKSAPGVQPTEVAGEFALWVSGDSHAFMRRGSDRARLSDTALLWHAHGVTYRVETDLGPAQAVRLAESLQ